MSKKRKNKQKSPPVSIRSEGDFLLINNQLSAKAHERMLEQMREHRPQLYQSLKQQIDHVIKQVNQFNKIDLLGGFGVLLINEKQVYAGTDRNAAELNLEYVLSIALATPNLVTTRIPTAEQLAPLSAQLERIRQGFVQYYLAEAATHKLSASESKLRFDVLISALGVRGEGYEVHVEEVFTELFGLHDPLLQNHYGFATGDVLATLKQIERGLIRNQEKLQINHRQFLSWMKQQNRDEIFQTYGWVTPYDAFRRETGLSMLTPAEQYKFNLKELSESQLNVVKNLSLTFGENSAFLNPAFKAEPLNDTLVATKPIVHDGRDNYYCFSTLMAHRNLYTIGEALIRQADNTYFAKTYLGKSFSSRGSYVERKAIECLRRMVTNGDAYLNLKYDVPDEKGPIGATKEVELDGLLVSPTTLYLIEIKSGGFSNAARRGAIRQLSSDVRKVITEAVEQVNRAERYILDQDTPQFRTEEGRLIIVDRGKPVVKIVTSLSTIMGLTTQLQVVQDLALLPVQKRFPWVITLFDLLVFADLFVGNEASLLDYLNWRLPLYERANFSAMDELNLLGLFHSPQRDAINQKALDGHSLQLNSFTAKIDRYYTHLYLGEEAQRPFGARSSS